MASDKGRRWPLPNIWLGVSVENQATADERIPLLLQTPAAVRFISAEPLLGPIDLHNLDAHALGRAGGHSPSAEELEEPWKYDSLTAGDIYWGGSGGISDGPEHNALDWVICGGESGPGARPMHPEWARSLRDQCAAAGVPFFFKQWGEWQHGSDGNWDGMVVLNDGRQCGPDKELVEAENRKGLKSWGEYEPTMMAKVGKHTAGSLLDGVEWKQFPEVRG